jgi:NAD(P)-dependent dehydrogenase (short-subunit alcohol dehydrogenase family)
MSMADPEEFAGRVALVTAAAGKGIGQAIARRLAAGGARYAPDVGGSGVEALSKSKPGPLGDVPGTADIAEAVAFLASDRAAFITGEVLNVAGGSYMRT